VETAENILGFREIKKDWISKKLGKEFKNRKI
jgi:hypothetical protein